MADDAERAETIHLGRGDRTAAAMALRALGDRLFERRDPAARAVLEDAGSLFEELGDEKAVLEIDQALRALADEIEESPRSFQAGVRRMA
jgi:hypothetical protein